jgi:uncharacterized membrane protein
MERILLHSRNLIRALLLLLSIWMFVKTKDYIFIGVAIILAANIILAEYIKYTRAKKQALLDKEKEQ